MQLSFNISFHIQFYRQERQALLGNTYIRFQDDIDEVALGRAQDEASLLSRLMFYWVNPLIKKGMAGYLLRIDDLFMLPESLNVCCLTERLRHAIDSTRSLLRALHKSHGIEFYSIGILRLIADMSGFAGPLLLGGLLTHGAATPDPDDNVDGETDAMPYLYALGLFSTSLLCMFLYLFIIFFKICYQKLILQRPYAVPTSIGACL